VPKLEWDHVFPESWYPNGISSAERDKTVVPCCPPCNDKASPLEEHLRRVLITMVDITEPSAAGQLETALRGVRPWDARNERDRQHRQRKREQFEREILNVRTIGEGRLPGLEPAWCELPSSGIFVYGYPEVRVPTLGVRMLRDKLFRGLYRLETGKLLPPELVMPCWLWSEGGSKLPPIIAQAFHRLRGRVAVKRLPGNCLRYAFTSNYDGAFILIWNTHLLVVRSQPVLEQVADLAAST